MFCTACGSELRDTDRFCSSCGKPTSEAPHLPQVGTFPENPKRLVRTMRDKKIAGVCGGMAQFFGLDSTLVRFIFLALFLAYGAGLLVYIVGWIVMPKDTDLEGAWRTT